MQQQSNLDLEKKTNMEIENLMLFETFSLPFTYFRSSLKSLLPYKQKQKDRTTAIVGNMHALEKMSLD